MPRIRLHGAAALAGAAVITIALHGVATSSASVETPPTAVSRTSVLTPTVLPAGLKLVSANVRDRYGVAGTVETRTWAHHTKKEILAQHRGGGLGPTLTLTVLRGPAPGVPIAGNAEVARVSSTIVRGHTAWLATRSDGITYIGWSETGNTHVQAIAAGGTTLTELRAFVQGLVTR
jgi:hypothetical protein